MSASPRWPALPVTRIRIAETVPSAHGRAAPLVDRPSRAEPQAGHLPLPVLPAPPGRPQPARPRHAGGPPAGPAPRTHRVRAARAQGRPAAGPRRVAEDPAAAAGPAPAPLQSAARTLMAYDQALAERIRALLPEATEKAMFGALAFMLDGNMAV